MSQENVETFKRGIEAYNRGDIEAMLEDVDPDVEWHPGLAALVGGEATMYRGHAGFRELARDLDTAFAQVEMSFSEIRDLGDRVLAIGRLRARGKASGAEIESPFCYLTEFRNGKGIRVFTYLDVQEALEAAGLRE